MPRLALELALNIAARHGRSAQPQQPAHGLTFQNLSDRRPEAIRIGDLVRNFSAHGPSRSAYG